MQDQTQTSRQPPFTAADSQKFVDSERARMLRYGSFRFVHWMALIASITLTTALWQYTHNQEKQSVQARFDYEVDHTTDHILERLQKYELALWGGVSALKTNGDQMERAEWRQFADNLEIADRYPGINGIGVIHEIEADELDTYLARERIALPGYDIHPPHDQNIYRPITFIEPIDINAEAVGLDMVHESNRNSALLAARDSGRATITGPIVLVQDHDKTPGFLFYTPFYAGYPAPNAEARQSAFLGAVYAPFIVNKLVRGSLSQDRRYASMRISDGDHVIYDEIDADAPDYDLNPLASTRIELPVYGRTWQVDLRTGQRFREANRATKSNVVFLFGLIIDLALLTLFLMLTRAYQRGVRFAEVATTALKTEADALKEANSALDIAREDAESVSQMKSNFLATMSHEVRTPLTAIGGILVLLERTNPDQQNKKLIQAAQASSEKLMKLLTSVLDLSRLEADAVKLWERAVPLRPLIADWQTIAQGVVKTLEKDIDVRVDIDEDVPETLFVDDIRLSQIMGNLIDNAARFTRKGHMTIGLSHAPARGTDKGSVIFRLSDTGIGIAPADQDAIFDRFRQLDGSMTRENQGTGLGLAICQDLVKLMGGSITLRSTLKEGTTFEVTLPIKADPAKG